MFVTDKWVNNKDTDKFFAKVRCFPDRLQEPFHLFLLIRIRYLVLKYTSELPLFDERFVNYGYNKIEFMEQLRFYRTFCEMYL